MYNILLRLYIQGKVNEEHLEEAVSRGWITQIEKMQIVSV